MGTHDSLLIQVVTQRTKQQLEAIDLNYRQLPENTSKRSLNEFLKSECSGKYGSFLKYICKSRPNFLSYHLDKAMDGTDDTEHVPYRMLPATAAC